MLNYIRTQIDILRLPKDIRRWVRALRSGKYNQVKGTLEGTRPGFVGYCCLGVKAKIDGDTRLYPAELPEWDDYDDTDVDTGETAIYEDLRKDLDNDLMGNLVDMNDRGRSFKEISDYIIEHYKGK